MNEQAEQMLAKVKEMEPILGKGRVESFVRKTLQVQKMKKVITDDEYNELMSKLGYG